MSFLAFIPARGGSKGIPRKNMRSLNGKPLIQYTIEAALQSEFIDEIFLSSDDDEIIDFTKTFGIDVTYKRPASLATDKSSMIDTILHVLKWMGDKKPQHIVLLQPTSPLRTSSDIDNSIKKYLKTKSKSLVSVNEMAEHPYECIKLRNNSWEYLDKPKHTVSRRQDYDDKYYFINGAIYIFSTEFLTTNNCFIKEGQTELYTMNKKSGVDIDDLFDFKKAEALIGHEL